MGYHKRYDPEVLASDESMREQYMASEAYAYDLSDWLAEQAAEFEFSRTFEKRFEAWLDTVYGDDD